MKTVVHLKSIDDSHESLDITVAVDNERREVKLEMTELDVDLVASFLARAPVTSTRFRLFINLAELLLEARLLERADGRFGLRLRRSEGDAS